MQHDVALAHQVLPGHFYIFGHAANCQTPIPVMKSILRREGVEF